MTVATNGEIDYSAVEGLYDTKEGIQGTYLSVFDFTICKRTSARKEGDPEGVFLSKPGEDWEGPLERTNPKTKKPVFTYIKRYDRLIGRVADMSRHTKEFAPEKGGGKVTNWNFALLAGKETLILQLVYMDRVLKRFLKVFPNIDLDRPILISAFKSMKNGEPTQAVSFRQYIGDPADIESFKNTDKWTKVEEYWKRPVGPDGKTPIEGTDSVGKDGSILPQPIQDEDDDTWDYKAQNKFLVKYFKDNILPGIKERAERYGVESKDTHDGPGAIGESNGFTGGPAPELDDTPVTEKPWNPVAANMAEAAHGKHIARIKQLAEAQGINGGGEVAAQKLVAASLNELTDEAARYIIFKLEERMSKQPSTVLSTPKAQDPATVEAPVVAPKAPAPPADDDEDDDLWAGSDATPEPTAKPKQTFDPNDPLGPSTPAATPVADDDDWG